MDSPFLLALGPDLCCIACSMAVGMLRTTPLYLHLNLAYLVGRFKHVCISVDLELLLLSVPV